MGKSLASADGMSGHRMIWVTQGVTQHAAYLLDEKEGWKFVRWVTTRQDQWIDPTVEVLYELPSRRSRGPRPNYNDSIVAVGAREAAAADAPGSKPAAVEASKKPRKLKLKLKLKRGIQTKQSSKRSSKSGKKKSSAAETVPVVDSVARAPVQYKDDFKEEVVMEERIPRTKKNKLQPKNNINDDSTEDEFEWEDSPGTITNPSSKAPQPMAAAKRKLVKQKSKKEKKKRKKERRQPPEEEEDSDAYLDESEVAAARRPLRQSKQRAVNYKVPDSGDENDEEKEWRHALRSAVQDRTTAARAAAIGHCNSSEEQPPAATTRAKKDEGDVSTTMGHAVGRDAEPEGGYDPPEDDDDDDADDDDDDDFSTEDPHDSMPPSPMIALRSYPVGTIVAKEIPSIGWVSGKVMSVNGTMYTVAFENGSQKTVSILQLRAMVEDADMSRYPIGAPVRKQFPDEQGGWCKGTVISLDSSLYQVLYENGHEEQLGASALDSIIVVPRDSSGAQKTVAAILRKQTAGQCTASEAPNALAAPDNDNAKAGPKPDAPADEVDDNYLAAPAAVAEHSDDADQDLDPNTETPKNSDQGTKNTDNLLPPPGAAKEDELSSPASANKAGTAEIGLEATLDAHNDSMPDVPGDDLEDGDEMQSQEPESAVDLFLDASALPGAVDDPSPDDLPGASDSQNIEAPKLEIPSTLAAGWAKLKRLYPPKHDNESTKPPSEGKRAPTLDQPKVAEKVDEDISELTSRALLTTKKKPSSRSETSNDARSKKGAASKVRQNKSNDAQSEDGAASELRQNKKKGRKVPISHPPDGQPGAKKRKLANGASLQTSPRPSTGRMTWSGESQRGSDPPGFVVNFAADSDLFAIGSKPLVAQLPARPKGVASGFRPASKPRSFGKPQPRKFATRATSTRPTENRPFVKSYCVKPASAPKPSKWSSWKPSPTRPTWRAEQQLFRPTSTAHPATNANQINPALVEALRNRGSAAPAVGVARPTGVGVAPVHSPLAPSVGNLNPFAQPSWFNNSNLAQRWNAFASNFAQGSNGAVGGVDPTTIALYLAALQNPALQNANAQQRSAMPQFPSQQPQQPQMPPLQAPQQNQQSRRISLPSAGPLQVQRLPRDDP